jgi:basic membrane protein A
MQRVRFTASHLPKILLALGVSAAMLATSGCTGRGSESSGGSAGTKVESIAIVTPEKETDHGWNQQGLWAAQAVADKLNIRFDENSNVGYDNSETILTQVAESGAGLLIAHASGFATAGKRVGETTGVPTLVVDVPSNVPGTVATILTEAQQGAYLAGVAAALTTEQKKIGIVASAENANWFAMSSGFAEGVYSVDPSIQIEIAYIGPAEYADAAGGARVANQVIATGADIIFGMGDGATVGYLQAVENANQPYPVRYIATIGDVSPIDPKKVTLTSVLWNFEGAYAAAVADIENGSFGTKTYTLTVKNDGLTLQDNKQLSSEALAAVKTARQGIIDGSIQVTKAASKEEVQKVIDSKQ